MKFIYAMAGFAAATLAVSAQALTYPDTKKVDIVDTYDGIKVSDPYRWLEDDNAADTKAWVEAQNKVTFDYLAAIPARDKIKARLTALFNHERYGLPFREGGRYFWSKNDGLQPQSVLYTARLLDAEPKVLLDPNGWSKDGTMALAGYAVSDNGKYVAYGVSSGGSDWREWKVKKIENNGDLPDVIKWVKFSGAVWTKDSKGFFYGRYDTPNEGEALKGINYFQKLYYHRLGTSQKDDVLVYERPDDKELGLSPIVTEDGKFLVILISKGTLRKNNVAWMPLGENGKFKPGKVIEFLTGFEAQYNFVGNDGRRFFFKTDQSSPRGRIIAVDIQNPHIEQWKTLIAEQPETLQGANLVNQQIVASYLKDAYTNIRVYGLDGRFAKNIELPGIGTAVGFGGKRRDRETFFLFSSFTEPGAAYRYDFNSGQSTVFRKPKIDFDGSGFETKQVFYTSKDGTRVPMFLVHKKGIKLDGTNPTLLYGYGGFDIALTPSFRVTIVPWLEMGGIYAVANLRGGGEYGKEWHEAGTKLKKQNVFDDFIAAAEWLIASKYTSPAKLAINGGSNGGLLVGAVMNQRPDLFGAAVPEVGVMDMLRFHKFTIGWAWTSDYGSADNPEQFKALYAYSPLHTIKAGTKYPPTLVMTADHDDRVVPAHSFKYAAAMQAANSALEGSGPILIRVETRAGHGAGTPTQKIIEERADVLAFLMHALSLQPY
jgi:prolyl oligopeptidase